MDFIDQIRTLASRIENTKNLVQTEEATKNAMIMPFIQALGYNVFDPLEVTPEYVSDVGTKKGEKVDYAILKDGKPIMLVECKKCGGDLSISHAGQLLRYFHVTEAKFGVLSNGLTYRFFTDLENPNRMDEKPFFEFNILDFKDQDVEELKKFAKSSFDVEKVLATASELKYARIMQNLLSEWMTQPSDDFIRTLLTSAGLLSGKRFMPSVRDQFEPIVKRAFQQVINNNINDRLKIAMAPDPAVSQGSGASEASAELSSPENIRTTLEEIEGFHIVRTILHGVVDPRKVVMRDAQSYCAILFDDNNRKPICRLRFNNASRLQLGLFIGKEEERVSLADPLDIYKYADQLKATAQAYCSEPADV